MKINNIFAAFLAAIAFFIAFLGQGTAESYAAALASNSSGNEEIIASQIKENSEKTDNSSEKGGGSGDYLSGRFAGSSGDIDGAIRSLRSVYKKTPKNLDIAEQLSGLYLLAGKVDEAIKIAENIIKQKPKEPMSALLLSLKEISKGDAQKASKILDEVFADEGGQLWLPLISAWLDVERGKLTKPLITEELSAEVGRAAPIVNYHLALINAEAGFSAAAIENFKQAVPDPTNPPARVMRALLTFYKNNKSPAALKPLIDSYRKENKDDIFTDKPLIIDNMKDGTAEVLLTMGSIMLASDVTQDAAIYLQLTLYLNPNLEIAILSLAQAYGELRQYETAGELLKRIPENSPLYENAQLYYAVNLGRMKKNDEAIAAVDALIAASPDNLDAYMAKGDLLRSKDKFAEAIDVYRAALDRIKEQQPQHWSIFFALGTCFDKSGNWVDAQKNLRRSLELSPEQPDVLNYLGYSFLTRAENLGEAKELIEKAFKKRPSDPQIMDSQGWALYLSGDYKQAVLYLERAVSILPSDPTLNEHLGDVYWRLGRKTEARFQWDRAMTYTKDEAELSAINKKIEEGLPPLNKQNASEKKEKPASINAASIEQERQP